MLVLQSQSFAQTTESKFKAVWQKHRDTWAKSFTWQEHTVVTDYKQVSENDVYRAGILPDKFREDRGSLDDGNAELQVGSASFTFKKYKQAHKGLASANIEELILGRLYFQSFDAVKSEFGKFKIDITKGRTATWKGRKVLIFGVTNPIDTVSEQIWYDATELYPVRWMYQSTQDQDIQYLGYRKINGVWFPSDRKVYGNRKLRQHTKFLHVSFNSELNPAIFDPEQFGSYHWLQ